MELVSQMNEDVSLKACLNIPPVNFWLKVVLFIVPVFLNIVVSWSLDLNNEFVDLVSTLVIMLPVVAGIGRAKNQKWIIILIVISGFTVGRLLSSYFIVESNLWPFAIVSAPIMSIPAIVFYLVIMDFLERCKSDPNLKW